MRTPLWVQLRQCGSDNSYPCIGYFTDELSPNCVFDDFDNSTCQPEYVYTTVVSSLVKGEASQFSVVLTDEDGNVVYSKADTSNNAISTRIIYMQPTAPWRQ